MSMNDFDAGQTGNTSTRLERLEKELGILRSQVDTLLTVYGRLRDEEKKDKKKARIINPPITMPRKRGRPKKSAVGDPVIKRGRGRPRKAR